MASLLFTLAGTLHAASSPLADYPDLAKIMSEKTADVTAIRQKADTGDAKAEFEMALCYFNGIGVPQNDKEALKWVKTSAEHGYPDAEVHYGTIYDYSNHQEAEKWYLKAVEQGNSTAAFCLYEYYGSGQSAMGAGYPIPGAKLDQEQATKWLWKSADLGNGFAWAELADRYHMGNGVKRDDVEAYKWLSMALSNSKEADIVKNYAIYQELKSDLDCSLTSAQIAEAKKRAQEWLSKFQKRK